VVVLTNARVDPSAVMIKAGNASVARSAAVHQPKIEFFSLFFSHFKDLHYQCFERRGFRD
jgi:hypothetical protein